MIYYLVLGILAAGFVLASIDFFFAPDQDQPKDEPQSSLPDVPGVFTPEQATRYIRMKAQYGAKPDDLPDTNDEATQMRTW